MPIILEGIGDHIINFSILEGIIRQSWVSQPWENATDNWKIHSSYVNLNDYRWLHYLCFFFFLKHFQVKIMRELRKTKNKIIYLISNSKI